MCKNFKIFLLLVLHICIHQTTSGNVIYRLDPENYYRMPLKYHVDRFEPCLGLSGGVYCTVHADVVSDRPSELLDMMKSYSAHLNHYNYTNIKYGLCITKSCRQFYEEDNNEPALWKTTEACLNESFSRQHDLKTRVTQIDCHHHGQKFSTDAVDVGVGLVLVLILALNLAGTVYDVLVKGKNKTENKILMVFSIRSNWRRLVATPRSKPQTEHLQCLQGLRGILSCLVVCGHLSFPTQNFPVSTYIVEENYHTPSAHFYIHGWMVTLNFFFITGFLLTYELMTQMETKKLSWTMIPNFVASRWLRFSPTVVVIMMFTAVWHKHTGLGPFWNEFIAHEAEHCRKYWIYNVLYISNWIDHSLCNLQLWSMASDIQLCTVALATLVLAPSKRARRWVMGILYLMSTFWYTYLIYANDWKGSFVPSPKAHNGYMITEDSFNYLFKRPYSSLPTFIIGMAFAEFVYSLKKKNLLVNPNYKKYYLTTWLALLMSCLTTATGYIFYLDIRMPLLIRIMYTPIIRPLFSLWCITILLGVMCKASDSFSTFLNWPGWEYVSRISFCMYLTHMIVIRFATGTRDTLVNNTFFYILYQFCGALVWTIIISIITHLLVEKPFSRLHQMFTMDAKPTKVTDSADDRGSAANDELKSVSKKD